jgi:two-component system KDP operon response regulator KdpE
MRILVIDDDTSMTDLLTILLTPASSEVFTANCAVDGVQMAREKYPDVVILDLIFPQQVGWEVCKSIREFSNVPILILSALDNPGMVAQALDNGADDYVTKPISSGTLIAHLNKLVRRSTLAKKNKLLPENGH